LQDAIVLRGSLPLNLEQSVTAVALRAIRDLDLTDLAAVAPPLGYRRD
jgi:hypothetical protein